MDAGLVYEPLPELTEPQPKRRFAEVLAPAGDDLALEAALAAGADAVYFGVSAFNARARAQNFAIDGLAGVMARVHGAGARGYVTLNTLVFDTERDAVRDVIVACDQAGVDALIIQDLGVARWVRELAPSMPLHASTQMTCTDAAALSLARSMGISRAILPRELSVREIAKLRKDTELELEAFVHGALCVSYSGQCLASLLMGGRSANRGLCAQPCRLPYALIVDGEATEGRYALSPADLDASGWIPQLLDAGVTSLKIEGRLKGPSYVAATVRLVRGVVRAWEKGHAQAPEPETREAALQMFSRGSGPGFLGGGNHQTLVDGRSSDHRGLVVGVVSAVRRVGKKAYVAVHTDCGLQRGDGLLVEASAEREEVGGRVWLLRQAGRETSSVDPGMEAEIWLGPERVADASLVGRRLFRTSAPRLEALISKWIAQGRPRTPIAVSVSGTQGEPVRIRAVADAGLSAAVLTGAPLQRAMTRPLTREVLWDKLGRLGDTRFELSELEVSLPQGVMLPLSSVNDARRRLVEELEAEQKRRVSTRDRALEAEAPSPLPPPPPSQLTVLCRTDEQARAAVGAGASSVVLDLGDARATRRWANELRGLAKGRLWIGVATLRVRKPGEGVLDEVVCGAGVDGVLVRSWGALHALSASHPELWKVGDASLNVANSSAARAVLSKGLGALTPSWDLSDVSPQGWYAPELMRYVEVVVYGARTMFHTQHCLFAANVGTGSDCTRCDRPCERVNLRLRDRTGRVLLVRADRGGRNTVFESEALDRIDQAGTWHALGVRRFRVELLEETGEQAAALVKRLSTIAVAGAASACGEE